jgi:uncharacterized damage-inducible protein DinB
MKLTDFFLDQLTAEGARTRRALEAFPDGKDEWKPHDKSMPFGRLANLCAMMPMWFALIIKQDELDLTPPAGQGNVPPPSAKTASGLVAALDQAIADGRAALESTSDAVLTTTKWRLKAGGQVVSDELRHLVIRDTFNHLAHHRGQFTVYLRLAGGKVPSIYGPSADDQRFL